MLSSLILTALIAALSLLGCKGKGKTTTEKDLVAAATPGASDYSEVHLLPGNTTISPGRTVSFEALGILPYGITKTLNEDGEFTLSDSNFASLIAGKAGKVRALKTGQTTLTFNYGEYTKSAVISVADRTLDQIEVSQKALNYDGENVEGVLVPKTESVQLLGYYGDGSIEDLTQDAEWISDSPDLIESLGNGNFRFLAIGTANITVSVLHYTLQIPVTITTHPKTFTSFRLNPSLLILEKDSPVPFQVFAEYSNGQSEDITSTASIAVNNSSLVSIQGSTTKTIAGAQLGSGILTIDWNGHQQQKNFKVIDPLTTQIIIDSPVKNFALAKGETETFVVKLRYSDNSEDDVTSAATFEVTDATVLGTESGTAGLFRALKAGSTQLTASFISLRKTETITVSSASITGIELSSVSTGNLGLNLNRTFVAKARYTDNSLATITNLASWTIQDLGGAGSVVSAGVIKGTVQGNIRINASYLGRTGSIDLSVGPAVPMSIEILPVPSSGPVLGVSIASGNQQLSAVVTYSDNTVLTKTSEASWSYAIVGENFSFAGIVRNSTGQKGILVPLAAGFFRVDATFEGITGSRVVEVSP